MSLSVTPQAHDIIFTFSDSCNCCRPCKINDDRFYINSQGNLERFKVRKANGSPDQAFERAMQHLTATLERKVVKFKGDPDLFSGRVDKVFRSISSLREINRSHIEAINDIMLLYIQESSPLKIEEPPPSRCVIL